MPVACFPPALIIIAHGAGMRIVTYGLALPAGKAIPPERLRGTDSPRKPKFHMRM